MNTGPEEWAKAPVPTIALLARIGYCRLADGLAGTPDFMVIDVGVHVHDVFAHLDRHDDFFQRAVTGAFADTVHRAFYLTSASVDGGEGVADGDT